MIRQLLVLLVLLTLQVQSCLGGGGGGGVVTNCSGNPGTYLEDGSCKFPPPPKKPKCKGGQIQKGDRCVDCKTGTVWKDNDCRDRCNDASTKWDDKKKTCLCSGGKYWHKTKKACVSCAKNQKFDGKKCVPCPTGMIGVGMNCQCKDASTKCDDKKKACVSRCSGGKYWHKTKKACVGCAKNQKFDGKKCVPCPTGMIGDGTKCQTACRHSCIDVSTKWDDKKQACVSRCSGGKYWDETKKACFGCAANQIMGI